MDQITINTKFKLNGRQSLAINRFSQYDNNTNGILLMHSVGSGKTITSIVAAINSFDFHEDRAIKQRTILAVVPSGLFDQMAEDIHKNIPKVKVSNKNPEKYYVFTVTTPYGKKYIHFKEYKYSELTAKVNTISIDRPDELVNPLREVFNDKVIIFDEAHRLLRPINLKGHSILTMMIECSALQGCIKYIVMTGTPYSRSALDMIEMARFVDTVGKTPPYKTIYDASQFSHGINNRPNMWVARECLKSVLLNSIKMVLNLVPFAERIRGGISFAKCSLNYRHEIINRYITGDEPSSIYKLDKPMIDALLIRNTKNLNEPKPNKVQTDLMYRDIGLKDKLKVKTLAETMLSSATLQGVGVSIIAIAGFAIWNMMFGGGMTISDAYEVLNLPHTATILDIKATYKRLALKLHPDKCGESCKERFQKLNEAYNILICEKSNGAEGQCENDASNDTTSDNAQLDNNGIPITYSDFQEAIQNVLDKHYTKEQALYMLQQQDEFCVSEELTAYLTTNQTEIDAFLNKFVTPASIPSMLDNLLTLDSRLYSANELKHASKQSDSSFAAFNKITPPTEYKITYPVNLTIQDYINNRRDLNITDDANIQNKPLIGGNHDEKNKSMLIELGIDYITKMWDEIKYSTDWYSENVEDLKEKVSNIYKYDALTHQFIKVPINDLTKDIGPDDRIDIAEHVDAHIVFEKHGDNALYKKGGMNPTDPQLAKNALENFFFLGQLYRAVENAGITKYIPSGDSYYARIITNTGQVAFQYVSKSTCYLASHFSSAWWDVMQTSILNKSNDMDINVFLRIIYTFTHRALSICRYITILVENNFNIIIEKVKWLVTQIMSTSWGGTILEIAVITIAAIVLYKLLVQFLYGDDVGLGTTSVAAFINASHLDVVVDYDKVAKSLASVYSVIDVSSPPVKDTFSGKWEDVEGKSLDYPGFCETNIDIIMNTIEYQPIVGFRYPKKEEFTLYVEYDSQQIAYLNRVGGTDKTDWFFAFAGNQSDPRNGFSRSGGNFSKNVDYLLSKYKQNEGQYPTYDVTLRTNMKYKNKFQVGKHTNESPNIADSVGNNLFVCRKFCVMLAHILLIKTGNMMTADGVCNIPHMTHAADDDDLSENPYDDHKSNETVGDMVDGLLVPIKYETANRYYLPLVYSCTDEVGGNLFGAFLNSWGLKYIVLNGNNNNLNKEKARLTKRCYPLFTDQAIRAKEASYNLDNLIWDIVSTISTIDINAYTALFDKLKRYFDNQPICAILHPDMTEGLDCKFNPAIFLMEPPNSYGDYDQLCGRVLRTYRSAYKEAPRKMVYQICCFNIKNLKDLYRRRASTSVPSGDELFYDKNVNIHQDVRHAIEQHKGINIAKYALDPNRTNEIKPTLFDRLNLVWWNTIGWMNTLPYYAATFTNIKSVKKYYDTVEGNYAINRAVARSRAPGHLIFQTRTDMMEWEKKRELYTLRIDEYNIRYEYTDTAEHRSDRDTAGRHDMLKNYVDKNGDYPTQEAYNRYVQASNYLDTHNINEISPDITMIQSLYRIKNQINAIQERLKKTDCIDYDNIIINVKKAPNSQYIPYCDSYTTEVTLKECTKLVPSTAIPVQDTAAYNSLKAEIIKMMKDLYISTEGYDARNDSITRLRDKIKLLYVGYTIQPNVPVMGNMGPQLLRNREVFPVDNPGLVNDPAVSIGGKTQSKKQRKKQSQPGSQPGGKKRDKKTLRKKGGKKTRCKKGGKKRGTKKQ